jgi:hypothetical protein
MFILLLSLLPNRLSFKSPSQKWQCLMLSLFAYASLSLRIPARTALIFPKSPIGLANVGLVYGGYFPSNLSLSFLDSDLSQPHFNVTFPATCQRIIVSSRVPEDLTIRDPIGQTCVWYISKPSLIVFTVGSPGDGLLTVDSIDGIAVDKKIGEGTAEFKTKFSILFRWRQSLDSADSFAKMRAISRDNSFPYKSQIFEDFRPADAPRYFTAE